MGPLFRKIFLWFWCTLILIGVAVAGSTVLYIQNSDRSTIQNLRSRVIKHRIQAIRQALRFDDEQTVFDLLQWDRENALGAEIFVLDELDQELLGRSPDWDSQPILQYRPVISEFGQSYQIYSSIPPNTPPAFAAMFHPFRQNPGIVMLWLGVAISLSSIVCFGLAWYLTRPVLSLQRAARKLSAGQPHTPVHPVFATRNDELTDLALEFDGMAERLQKLMQQQKELLGNVSHELRSPLSRLQVALALARRRTDDQSKAELDRIETESDRLQTLVGEVLTLSRLESGAAYPKDDYLDIEGFVNEIIRDCRYETGEPGKEIILTSEKSLVLQVNGELLRRAFENLIRNAVHHTPPDTTVNVELQIDESPHQLVKISVCDHGPGVPDNQLENLFEPFFRVQSSRNRNIGGFGLGLAIAKHAIRHHGGTIYAQTRKSGGLCVHLEIPCPQDG